MMSKRTLDSHVIETSNEDKPLFGDGEITKGDLIDHYLKVADVMLPHMRGRPLTMQRFPDGIDGEGFYHKDAPEHFPDWIQRAPLPKSDGSDVNYVVCQNAATLVYLANQACITPHTWLSRRDRPHQPDRIVIDLDPPGDDFDAVRQAARWVADTMDQIGLRPFFQLTGSRGVHVVTPIRRGPDFDESRGVAQRIARLLVERHPEELTTAQRKEKRGDRVFLDTGRNAYGQTMVTPYAVRARRGAPVATPVDRDELGDSSLTPRKYTIRNIMRRLGHREDPWNDIADAAKALSSASKGLREIANMNDS